MLFLFSLLPPGAGTKDGLMVNHFSLTLPPKQARFWHPPLFPRSIFAPPVINCFPKAQAHLGNELELRYQLLLLRRIPFLPILSWDEGGTHPQQLRRSHPPREMTYHVCVRDRAETRHVNVCLDFSYAVWDKKGKKKGKESN